MTRHQVLAVANDQPTGSDVLACTAAPGRRFLLAALWTAALLWAAALWALPLLAGVADTLTAVVYAVGAAVCHQEPERSFHVAGMQLAVCARCTALYMGAAVGLGAWWFRTSEKRPRLNPARMLRWTMVAAAPVIVTVVCAWLGIWDASNIARASVSWPLGMVGGVVVGAALTDHLR